MTGTRMLLQARLDELTAALGQAEADVARLAAAQAEIVQALDDLDYQEEEDDET